MDRLNIVNVIEDLDVAYGGPAQSVPGMLCALSDRGHRVTLVSGASLTRPPPENPLVHRCGMTWVKTLQYPPQKVRWAPNLRNVITRQVSDHRSVVHVQNLWNYFPLVAGRVALERGIPLIFSIRGTLSPWSLSQNRRVKQLAWRLFQRRLLQRSSCLHVTSQRELEFVRGLGLRTPVALIPNGTFVADFSSGLSQTDARRAMGLSPDARYLLFLSRVHPKKGLDLLCRVWRQLVLKHSIDRDGWQLLIGGPVADSVYWQSCLAHLDTDRLQNSFRYLGMLKDSMRISAYKAADLFCLPSYSENFGIVALEALSSGTPVVTTTETPWESVVDHDAGAWIPPRTRDLYEALRALVLDNTKREAQRKNASVLAAQYDWSEISHQMESVYRWVSNGCIMDPPSNVAIWHPEDCRSHRAYAGWAHFDKFGPRDSP